MGADASIYSMIRPQQAAPDPMQQYGQVMQMRTLMGQQGLQDLQRQQVERGMADDLKVRDLFSKGNVTPEQLMAIDPKAGMAYGKSQLENKKAQGEIDKNRAETLLKQSTYMRDRLAGVQDQNGYNAWLEEGKSMFGPDIVRSTPPQFSPEVKNALLMKAEDLIVPLAKKLELESAARGQNITMRGQDMTDARTKAEGAAGRAVTVRGQDLVNARAEEAAGTDKFGDPKEVTGTNGRPMLVMQNKRTGEMVDANTKQPVGGVGPKLGETSQKQLAGVQTTKDAIAEYSAALKNWSATDIVRPDARAKMGTIYNNMMLQAKEAYNLGVLNGPDYMILQEVITSPASLKGGITSNEALGAQAAKLDEIMGKIGQQVTATQSGVTPPAAPKPSKAAPALGARDGGYIFKGGDPSNPKSWEKERK